MRLVQVLRRKQTWAIAIAEAGDGLVKVSARDYNIRYLDATQDELVRRLGAGTGLSWRVVPNVVVQAAMRPVGMDGKQHVTMVDRDTGDRFEMVGQSTYGTLSGLLDGHLRMEDGHAVGLWTFVLKTGSVYVEPYLGAGLPEAPPGAPDLSDFVRGLGA